MPPVTIKLLSHAKLNWYLRVFEPRADGYHDLDTIFQELEIADELTFTRIDEARCEIDGFPCDVPNETNLITRAWNLLRDAHLAQVKGLHCHAVKRLPRGGGLGGGSSNAAAALKAINTLYDLAMPMEQLQHYAARLGSDVPFFIGGGLRTRRGARGKITGN